MRYTAAQQSDGALSTVFELRYYCQAEVVSDVIPGMVNQNVGINVCANFGILG